MITDINTSLPGDRETPHSNIPEQYQVILDVTTSGQDNVRENSVYPIIASLPEEYNISLSSNWSTPAANSSFLDQVTGLTGRLGAGGKGGGSRYGLDGRFNQLVNGGLAASGIGSVNKYQLAQIWDSTSALEFNLTLKFNAITNTRKDVRDKHIALLKLLAPSEIGLGFLSAPGPSLIGQALGGRNISLQLGTYLLLDNVIVKNVSTSVKTLCGEDGIPHHLTIDIQVSSYFAVFTTNDIDKMFR